MKQAIKDTGQLLDPVMACYHASHTYPGGLSVIAMLMNVNYNTLQKKLNPTQEFHVLTVKDMLQIMHITGDKRIIEALCTASDGVFIANDDVPPYAGDVDLLGTFSEFMRCASDVQSHMTNSLENDGCIDINELSKLKRMQSKLDKAQAMITKLAEQYKG